MTEGVLQVKAPLSGKVSHKLAIVLQLVYNICYVAVLAPVLRCVSLELLVVAIGFIVAFL